MSPLDEILKRFSDLPDSAVVPTAVAAIWGIVQTVEKITNWPINREILKLQRDKLRKELSENRIEQPLIPTEEGFRFQLRSREADYFFDRTTERLQRGSVQVKELDVRVISHLPKAKN